MAPANSEVYVNDERKGSVGSSGRVVLSDIPAGRHILRVSKAGERDDERLIEVREGGQEQVIQAQLRAPLHGSHPSPSQGSPSSGHAQSSVMPGIVACSNCGSKFAEGVRFCGRCGSGRSIGECRRSGPIRAGCSNHLQPTPLLRTCGIILGRAGSGMTAHRRYQVHYKVRLRPAERFAADFTAYPANIDSAAAGTHASGSSSR